MPCHDLADRVEVSWRGTAEFYRGAGGGGGLVGAVIGEESGPDQEKRINRFGFNVALRLNGGLRTAPVLLAESKASGATVFDYSAGFSEQLPVYFRGDLRIYFQKNSENWSSMLSLDIQNFTGQQNTAYRYYDRFLDEVTTRYQLEFIPLLSYRINF